MRSFFNKIKENFFAENDRFILWLPVLFGLGIGIYFALDVEPSYWFTIVVVESLLALLYFFRYNPIKYMFIGSLIIVALGFSNIQIRSMYQSKFIEDIEETNNVTYLKGRIVKIDKSAKGKVRLLLSDVADFDTSKKGLYRITLPAKKSSLKDGVCVEMVATVMPPMPPIMPNTYQFNRKSFFEGISALGYANSNVFEIDCEQDLSFSQKLAGLINQVRKKIAKNIYSVLLPDEAAVTSAILAGDRTGISDNLYQQYRDSGLAHFLSISGLHMSMIAALTFFAIRLLMSLIPTMALKYDSKKTAAIFAIFMSFVYLLISGADIPVQRAFIMTFIVLLGVLFSRNAISMRMLSFAAFVVLVISPYALISASFQMSFAAVLVLISFYEKYAGAIQKFFKGKNIVKIILAYIIGLLISDFVASIATLPFAVYHFNTVAIYTTLGNLLAGPIIGLIIMPFVLISLFLMPFNLYVWPLKIVGFGVKAVNDITAYVSSLPNAGYHIISMPFWGLLLIVIGGLWLCIWQRKWRLWGVFPIVVGILSIFTTSVPDVIFSADAKSIAVKDNYGNMLVLQNRKNDFIKQIWLEKTASQNPDSKQEKILKKIYKGKKTDKSWVDIECDEKTCLYKNSVLWNKGKSIEVNGENINLKQEGGGVVYFSEGKAKVKTIRSAIGKRLWN